jgi:hypothetical protein
MLVFWFFMSIFRTEDERGAEGGMRGEGDEMLRAKQAHGSL